MQRLHLTNQVNTKQGYLCLLLLLVSLVFSGLASLKMTLEMLPSQSSVSAMQMVHADSQAHKHCHSDNASTCQMSDNDHDHQGCTQAHCSTLPVLATPYHFISIALQIEQRHFIAPMTLSGVPNTPYIPPIA